MNILVTGVKGQLGYDVVKEINKKGIHQVEGIDYEDLDITNGIAVMDFFSEKKYDIIIHCAAYTAVDKAEDEEDLCRSVNVSGTLNLLTEASKMESKFIFISTDYVFDGKKVGVYEVDDVKNPLSVYGTTKCNAEGLVLSYDKSFVLRTSWVYGFNGHNFVKTMLRLSETKNSLNVINDQIGSPTYTPDLAKIICDLMETDKFGIYHTTNEGFCSWYDFASKIFELINKQIEVNPIPTSEYKTKATRPLNSRLSKQKLVDNGFNLLPTWQDALKRYLIEIGEIKE